VLNPATLRVGDTILARLERYPQIELELQQVMSSDVLARLRNGTLDAGFFFGRRAGERHRQHRAARRRLSRERSPRRARTSSSRPNGRRSRSSRGSSRPRRARTTSSCMNLFAEGAPRPERIIEADSESVINDLVESGVGVSLIRDEIAAQSIEAGRSVIWPGRHVRRSSGFVYPPEPAIGPADRRAARCPTRRLVERAARGE
jgi:DNA-binding transcriptional LysR family regulator